MYKRYTIYYNDTVFASTYIVYFVPYTFNTRLRESQKSKTYNFSCINCLVIYPIVCNFMTIHFRDRVSEDDTISSARLDLTQISIAGETGWFWHHNKYMHDFYFVFFISFSVQCFRSKRFRKSKIKSFVLVFQCLQGWNPVKIGILVKFMFKYISYFIQKKNRR